MDAPNTTIPTFERFHSVPELLEHTLLYLKPTELFLCQRVCHRWRDIINTSHPILKHLWYIRDEHLASTPRRNGNIVTYDCDCDTTQFNPHAPRFTFSMFSSRSLSCASKPLRHMLGTPFPRCPIPDTPGSWMGMFFAQPPRSQYIVTCFDSRDSSRPRMRYVILCRRERSLYMGEMTAALAEIWDRQQRGVDRWRDCVHNHMSIVAHNDASARGMHLLRGTAELMRYMLDLEDKEADVCVAVQQAGGQVDPAFSLRGVQRDLEGRWNPRTAAAMRFEKTDYPMAFRWAGWQALYRLNTGYEARLVKDWRPFDPAGTRRTREPFEKLSQADTDCHPSILKTLTDTRVCGLVAALAKEGELVLDE